jgi:hypothetical protein
MHIMIGRSGRKLSKCTLQVAQVKAMDTWVLSFIDTNCTLISCAQRGVESKHTFGASFQPNITARSRWHELNT